jgi:hypothetical protein
LNESDNALSYIAQHVMSALFVTVGSGRALGNEHEFAARAIWGLPHIQQPVAMDEQARLHLVAAAESESRI